MNYRIDEIFDIVNLIELFAYFSGEELKGDEYWVVYRKE